MKIYDNLKDEKWVFGQKKEYKKNSEKKFDWALVDLFYDVDNGFITGKAFSDCLQPQFIDQLNESLDEGFKFDNKGIKDAIAKLEGDDKFKKDLEKWLISLKPKKEVDYLNPPK